MARAIAALLKDSQRRAQMGEAGFSRVQRVFSAERMVERTLEVYRDYAGRSGRGGDRDLSTDTPHHPAPG
jgi:glycosyltransferase involved in cell wall biosynthesis